MGLGVFGTFRTGGNSFLCFYFDAAFVLRCLRRRRRRHLSLMRVASCFVAPCIQCGIFSICRKLGFQQKKRKEAQDNQEEGYSRLQLPLFRLM